MQGNLFDESKDKDASKLWKAPIRSGYSGGPELNKQDWIFNSGMQAYFGNFALLRQNL